MVPACGESHSRAREKPGQSSLCSVQAAAASGGHSLYLLPRPWILGKVALESRTGSVRPFLGLSFLICPTWTSVMFDVLTELCVFTRTDPNVVSLRK